MLLGPRTPVSMAHYLITTGLAVGSTLDCGIGGSVSTGFDSAGCMGGVDSRLALLVGSINVTYSSGEGDRPTNLTWWCRD